MKLSDFKHGRQKRLEFIEFQLFWEGSIGRKELQDKFGVSSQQATIDLMSYQEFAPNNMVYDVRRKTYVLSKEFKKRIISGESAEYLEQVLRKQSESSKISDSLLTWEAKIYSVPDVERKIDSQILQSVANAIKNRQSLTVGYVSLSSESVKPRQIVPIAFGYDGHRWHVRAYDRDNSRFSDFAVSRITEIHNFEPFDSTIPEDKAWETVVNVQIVPDSGLASDKRSQLENEYDMENGKLSVEVRRAVLFYFLRNFGFDPVKDENGRLTSTKSAFRLELHNKDDVEKWLNRMDE